VVNPKRALLTRIKMPKPESMTIFAFPFLYFIQNKCMIFFCDIFMALCTWNILMATVKPEGRGIMIKIINFPQICIMTSLAIRYSIVFKLLIMRIRMAGGTC
jgi:hypothetical protein